MQVGEQSGHLLFCEAAGEAGHLAFAEENLAANDGVRGRDAAWELGALQHRVNLRRRGLEGQIVVFMTMGATDGVKMLALCLLRG